MGFAVVDVNMRGTGCSGGAFNYFEPLQNLDAYDVIQTIAHQPWVLRHKVGMFGVSYGGISQLFAAQLRPPALEAIAPLSVVDATATTLYPGGILNTGFAVPWAEDRQFDAEPAGPSSGEHWAYEQIQKGDHDLRGQPGSARRGDGPAVGSQRKRDLQPVCGRPAGPGDVRAQHQRSDVHGMPVAGRADRRALRRPGGALHRHDAQVVHVHQRRPHRLARSHTPSTDWTTSWSCSSRTRRRSTIGAILELAGADPLPERDGTPSRETKSTLPPDPIQKKRKYAEALSAFTALPQVRVLFDNGAGTSPAGNTTPGNPYPTFEQSFSAFPIPGTTARSWYLGPEGTLEDEPAAAEGVDSYTSDASATPLTDYSSNAGPGGLWGVASQWEWNWAQPTAGSAVSYVSAPLSSDTTAIGGGAVNLWVQSSTPDVDLQATISEVRPDGNETFVQNGWIRASERKLATTSTNMFEQTPTALEPIPTFLASDVQPMPAGEFVPVTIPLYFEGHAYRAGSRIRVTISAPNGNQPVWSFNETRPEGDHRRCLDRVRAGHALQPHPPGRARRRSAHRTAALPEPAQRALPLLPGVREQRFLTATRAGRTGRFTAEGIPAR